jgi:hypothetical protein
LPRPVTSTVPFTSTTRTTSLLFTSTFTPPPIFFKRTPALSLEISTPPQYR